MAEIVRKIGQLTRYETKSYVGDQRILDLDRASGQEGGPDPDGSEEPRPSVLPSSLSDASESEHKP
jgi:hypothetical protein